MGASVDGVGIVGEEEEEEEEEEEDDDDDEEEEEEEEEEEDLWKKERAEGCNFGCFSLWCKHSSEILHVLFF
jgi:hypothetical protein